MVEHSAQRRLRWIAQAFAFHPNTEALDRLLRAVADRMAVERQLAAFGPNDPVAQERLKGQLEAVRARIRAAAKELGVDLTLP